jgi:endogenous inhibitor of DNA gyrase (YacG/DUF329 family)
MFKEVRCPTCRRLTLWDGNPCRPFCSERCKLADLGNWASERYRIAAPSTDAVPEETVADEEDDAEPR